MLLFGMPNGFELLIIAFLVLLLFGKNKLPELARGLGSGIHEFRKGISGQLEQDEADDESESAPVKKTKSVKAASLNSAKNSKTKKAKAKS